jgi:hypothetical protein
VYKGKAVRLDLSWRRNGDDFDPAEHSPKFLKLEGYGEHNVVFPADLAEAVRVGLWSPIENSQAWRQLGIPLKRGVLLAGPYGCLAGDSVISVNRGSKGFGVQIRDLCRRFNGEDARYQWDRDIPTMVQREMPDGTIRLGRVLRVWSSGVKKTFRLTTAAGRSIRATGDHRFLTERGYQPLENLTTNDLVHVRGEQASVEGDQRERGERAQYKARSVGPHHPYGKGSLQAGWHVGEHRLVAEARENGLALAADVQGVDAQVVRWHVGGDIYSAAYAGKMIDVMRACPRTRFFAYTRSWRVPAIEEVLHGMATLPNIRLWYSADRDTGYPPWVPPRARVAWFQASAEEVPPAGCSLVFRPQHLRKRETLRVNGVRVCPTEDGKLRTRKVTCQTCNVCYRPLPEEAPGRYSLVTA